MTAPYPLDVALAEDERECRAGLCDEPEDCGACWGEGVNADDGLSCYRCYGSGQVTPDHCCVCGGSPYCLCCRTCGATCVAACRCPITTTIGGKTVTL